MQSPLERGENKAGWQNQSKQWTQDSQDDAFLLDKHA